MRIGEDKGSMPFVWCKYISGKLMLVRWPNEKVCQPVYGS